MKWLKEIQEGNLEEVGTKAFELARLRRCGFPVPDGFVVTHSTCEKILSMKRRFSETSEGDHGLRRESAPEEDIMNRLIRGFRLMGSRAAVRSSGVKEDLPGASFAGQYETFLNVTDERGFVEAVKTCAASHRSARVRDYARQNSIPPDDLRLAVFVQEQVRCDASGVMFTINPVTGNDREMVVEAVAGLGEGHVSGRVQPDRYRVDGFSERVVERSLSSDHRGVLARPEGGTFLCARPRTGPLLSDTTLMALVRLGMEAQVLYGSPQDIEWGLAEDRLYILQARPMTSIGYQGIEGQWSTADFRDGGVASEVVTPLMWSLYERVWEPAMQSYLEEIRLIPHRKKIRWSKVFFGRPYWNLGAAKEALARLPGYKERNLDQDLGVEINYEGDGFVTPFTWRGLLRGIFVLFSLERSYATQKRKARETVKKFESLEKRFLSLDLSRLEQEELQGWFTDLVENRHFDLETAYFKTVFNTANARLDFKSALDRANKHGAGLGYLALLSGLKPLRTFEPLRELWKTSRAVRRDRKAVEVLRKGNTEEILAHPILGKALGDFLEAYGYHSTRELDLRVPRWNEDPSFILETLRNYSSLDDRDHPEKGPIGNRRLFLEEYQKLCRFFSGPRILRSKFFMRKLRRVRFYTWYREEVRDCSTRMYALLRRVSLEAGRRLTLRGILNERDDIFYLSFQEVAAILGGTLSDPAAIRRRIEANRKYMSSFRHFENPNEVGRRWQYENGGMESRLSLGTVHRGIPCAPGRASGPVRVLRDINESRRLRRGDILVTRFTDPGWTPLFSLVSGVVTQAGGILSHAAIIAREYGVPAVLSVQGATIRLRDDQRVIVDGNRGEVITVC